MQGHAAGDEKTLFEVEGYLLEDHDRDGQRQVKHRGQGRKQPHQFRPAVDPLNEKFQVAWHRAAPRTSVRPRGAINNPKSWGEDARHHAFAIPPTFSS